MSDRAFHCEACHHPVYVTPGVDGWQHRVHHRDGQHDPFPLLDGSGEPIPYRVPRPGSTWTRTADGQTVQVTDVSFDRSDTGPGGWLIEVLPLDALWPVDDFNDRFVQLDRGV